MPMGCIPSLWNIDFQLWTCSVFWSPSPHWAVTMSPFPQKLEKLSTFYGAFLSVTSQILDSCQGLNKITFILYTLKRSRSGGEKKKQSWAETERLKSCLTHGITWIPFYALSPMPQANKQLPTSISYKKVMYSYCKNIRTNIKLAERYFPLFYPYNIYSQHLCRNFQSVFFFFPMLHHLAMWVEGWGLGTEFLAWWTCVHIHMWIMCVHTHIQCMYVHICLWKERLVY